MAIGRILFPGGPWWIFSRAAKNIFQGTANTGEGKRTTFFAKALIGKHKISRLIHGRLGTIALLPTSMTLT